MDKEGIEQVLKIYFDASFEGSGEKMDRVFRPEAHIYGLYEGDTALKDTPRDQFVAAVGKFSKSAGSSGERRDEIHFIEFSSEQSAVAKVSLLVGSIHFTDLLTFVYLEGEWRVISKLYYGRPYKI